MCSSRESFRTLNYRLYFSLCCHQFVTSQSLHMSWFIGFIVAMAIIVSLVCVCLQWRVILRTIHAKKKQSCAISKSIKSLNSALELLLLSKVLLQVRVEVDSEAQIHCIVCIPFVIFISIFPSPLYYLEVLLPRFSVVETLIPSTVFNNRQ